MATRIFLFAILVLQCYTNSASALAPGRRLLEESLTDCLQSAGAKVVLQNSTEYDAARGHMFQHRFLWSPAAFVFASSTAHVSNAVNCAVKFKVGISPRSGGHSYEDYSLGGRDGVIVVDLGCMNEVKYNQSSMTATVGAGARLGPIKLALWNQGKVTIPAGTCPSVGVGGHALGGGWGMVSRKFGSLADNIVEAEVVIANGTVVTANSQNNPDLLFALKGAGANSFGIVTQFTFNVYDVSQNVTHFSYDFLGTEQAATVKAFQIWGQYAHPNVSASLYHDPSGGNTFYGIYLGPKSNLKPVLQNFFNNGPAASAVTELETDYITTVLIDGELNASDSISVLDLKNYTYEIRTFKAKSLFVGADGFTDEEIQTYASKLKEGPPKAYMIFDLFGGVGSANSAFPSVASAWVHRNVLHCFQMFTYWDNNPNESGFDIDWIESIWNAVRPIHGDTETYQNYIDSEMPLSFYYGSNLDRLIGIKRVWDHDNVFNFVQSIPLSNNL